MKINDLRLYLNDYLQRHGDLDIVFCINRKNYSNFEMSVAGNGLYFDIDILNPIEDDDIFDVEI